MPNPCSVKFIMKNKVLQIVWRWENYYIIRKSGVLHYPLQDCYKEHHNESRGCVPMGNKKDAP